MKNGKNFNIVAIMKKLMNIFVLVAAAAMALASCQKPEIENPEPQSYEYTFLIGDADASDDSDSKAVIGPNCVEWVSGDQMGVYTKVAAGTISNNAYGDITPGSPATMKVYSNQALAIGDYIYAYYPYSSANENQNLSVTLEIPAEQDGKDDMPMVAIPHRVESALGSGKQDAPAGKIKFANLGSVIEFNVYTETEEYASEVVTSVAFEADDKALAGAFTFDLTNVNYSEASTLSISELTEKEVVAKVSDLAVGTKNEPAIVRMVVAPGSYKGNVVVTTDKATYTFPISTEKEFKRSAIKPLGLKLRANVREENLDVWTLVASVDNMPDGEYVIISEYNSCGQYAALPSATTSSSPSYSVQDIFDPSNVTIEPETVPVNIIWNLAKGSDDKWTITNSEGRYLYHTESTTGLRVGSTEMTWEINTYDVSLCLLSTHTEPRYVGIFNAQDWRTYTTHHSNYKGSDVLYFYYHGTLEVKPSVSVSDVTGISARGVVDNELVYSIVNPDGSTESVSCDGTVVTAAGIVDGKVVYSVSENASTEAREGTITITYGEVEKVVKVSQNAPVFTSTREEIVLTAEEGADASFTITSDFGWTAALSEGAGFSVSPTSYEWAGDGKKSVTITASAANASEEGVLDLGTVTFTNSTTEQTITVTVKQESSYVDESLQTATLTFDNKSKRTAFSTDSQVWEENGVKFTNAKANSASNVADYYNPVRCYKSSSIAIEYSSNITQIVFVCGSSSYATALKNSITTTDDVRVSDSNVTVVLSTPSTSYTINQLSAQVQLKSLTVYAVGGGSGGTDPEPTLTERNLAFSSATATATMGEEFTEPTLSGVTDGVTYASSNTEVATVDASTGEVTLVAAGETTITAVAAADATYKAGTASYTLTVGAASSGGQQTTTTTTYTFNSKSWGDSTNSWTSGKDGNQLTSGQGVQVTTGVSGANATCKNSFSNVSTVVVKYCTNSSKGVGTIKITIGSVSKTFTVSKTGGTTLRDATFDFSADLPTGTPKIEVTCSTNSVYVNSIAITHTN